MRVILIFFFLQQSVNLCTQDHFVSYIDIENKPQIASQLLINEGEIYLSCILGCGQDYRQCSGLLKVDQTGEILKSLPIDSFSNNLDGMVFHNDTIYLNGEYNMGKANGFTTLIVNKELALIKEINYNSGNNQHFNYVSNNALIRDDLLIISGSSFNMGSSEQLGQIFTINQCKIDTNVLLEFSTFSTRILNMHLFPDKSIVLYLSDTETNGEKDSIHLIRLDTSFNQTFAWSKEIGRPHIPRGSATHDGYMIITVPNDTFSLTHDVWSLDANGDVNWIYNWENEIKITNIFRIEESNIGDLFVMGQLIDPSIFNDARHTAFVMRLDAGGNELWRRYFRNENEHSGLSGYVSDLVELDNGDLILTGQSRRLLYEDGEERIDQDIFWARIGGDGCINEDCSEVYIVTSSEDLNIAAQDQISIYPNPMIDNQLSIDIKHRQDAEKAVFYSLGGELIKEADLTYRINTLILDTNSPMLLVRILDKSGRLIHSEKVLRF